MNARPDPLHQAALLIVDMISDFGFPDGEKLAAEAGKAVVGARCAYPAVPGVGPRECIRVSHRPAQCPRHGIPG